MEKLEEYVKKSQFSDILRVNFDQKCLRGQKCLLMRSTENVIKYNRGPVVLYDQVPLDQLLVPLKITWYFSPKMPKCNVFQPKCDVFISDTTFEQFSQ